MLYLIILCIFIINNILFSRTELIKNNNKIEYPFNYNKFIVKGKFRYLTIKKIIFNDDNEIITKDTNYEINEFNIYGNIISHIINNNRTKIKYQDYYIYNDDKQLIQKKHFIKDSLNIEEKIEYYPFMNENHKYTKIYDIDSINYYNYLENETIEYYQINNIGLLNYNTNLDSLFNISINKSYFINNEYNEKSRLINTNKYKNYDYLYPLGSLSLIYKNIKFKYNRKGNIYKLLYYNSIPIILNYESIYKYDKLNRLIKIDDINIKSKYIINHKYSYNFQNQIISNIKKYKHSNNFIEYNYNYDSFGNIIKIEKYNQYRILNLIWEFEYSN